MKQIIIALAMNILQGLAQTVYDGMWAVIIEGVRKAEDLWRTSGSGEVRKKWVMDRALEWLESKNVLKWYNRKVLTLFLSYTLDRIIGELNAELGNGWAGKVSDLRRHLAQKIPFVD